MRGHLRTAFAALLAIALLALFLRQADLGEVWRELVRADARLILASLAVTALTYLLRAMRWQYLLAPLGRVSLANALKTTVIGFAATALLPARAGEVLRPWLLARKEGLSATATFATVILERVLDTVTVLLLFAGYLLMVDPAVAGGDPAAFARLRLGGIVAGALSLGVLGGMFVLAGHPATLDQLVRLFERALPARLAGVAASMLRMFADGLAIVRQPARLAVSLLLSLPLWLSIAAGIWFVSRAFHIDLPFTGAFLVMALLVIGVAVPTPGAVGGFHYFYQLAVTVFYHAPTDRAVGAAIVLHGVSFVPVALAGVALLAHEGLSLGRVTTLVRPEDVEGTA